MDPNNLTLIFFLIGFGILFYKCFLLIINKYKLQLISNKILIKKIIHEIINQYLKKLYQCKSKYKKIFIFF